MTRPKERKITEEPWWTYTSWFSAIGTVQLVKGYFPHSYIVSTCICHWEKFKRVVFFAVGTPQSKNTVHICRHLISGLRNKRKTCNCKNTKEYELAVTFWNLCGPSTPRTVVWNLRSEQGWYVETKLSFTLYRRTELLTKNTVWQE